MILAGPPGIGKTSSILCLSRQLLKDQAKQAVIELNASDDRGIDVVRDTIKSFAQKKVILQPNQHKIVILDEADSLTEGAQQALRMIISDYAETTRFVLSCNDSTKLIDPIQSRCAILRYTKLSDKDVEQRLRKIVEFEKIQIDNDAIEALVFTAEGDMRQAINNLQASFTGFEKVTAENVYKVCDVPNIEAMKKIVDHMQVGDFNQIQAILYPLWQEGYSAYDIANTINKLLQGFAVKNKVIQYELLRIMAFLKLRILEGLPTYL